MNGSMSIIGQRTRELLIAEGVLVPRPDKANGDPPVREEHHIERWLRACHSGWPVFSIEPERREALESRP